MRKRIFTFIAMAALGCGLGLYAQDTGTGTGWETLNPGSPLVLNEDFSGFDFYGNWSNTNNSNSKDATDPETLETIPANISGTKTINYLNSELEVIYTWDSCAFAPDWGVAYSVDNDGNPVDPDPTTPGVSNGFVEIARLGYGTLAGEFIVDLRAMEFVEAIQYSHSSCGGSKRGLCVLISLDDAVTWDTLRYQPGDYGPGGWEASFTTDLFDLTKTSNTYRCDPSGYGMLWEDAINDFNVMLQFVTTGGQALRIHDLKVYGDLPASNKDIQSDLIKVFNYKNNIKLNKVADVEVYDLNGKLITSAMQTNLVTLDDAPSGIYLVKVQLGNYTKTSKLVLYK